MEQNRQQSKDRVYARLGTPIRTERGFTIPETGEVLVDVFACGCEGRDVGSVYELSRPCAHHGAGNVVQVSDRRAPMVLLELSPDAIGLLGDLVGKLSGEPADDRGCINCELGFPMEFGMEKVTNELLQAGILERVAPGYIRLLVFNCYDPLTNEWY